MPRILPAALLSALMMGVAGCARVEPMASAPPSGMAPSAVDFSFDGTAPLAPAVAFPPWAALSRASADDEPNLVACVASADACASPDLVRFRRMLELAAGLEGRAQLNLVHEYFNLITWSSEVGRSRDTWLPLYQVAGTRRGDCEDIAFAKYFALRRLGWAPEALRVIVGWDGVERDWHALLAVQLDGQTLVLDSIGGLQRPRDFRAVRMVYSISELGIWDHAPSYAPVPQRAARIAALTEQLVEVRP